MNTNPADSGANYKVGNTYEIIEDGIKRTGTIVAIVPTYLGRYLPKENIYIVQWDDGLETKELSPDPKGGS